LEGRRSSPTRHAYFESFWDSLALITEEVVAGVSERVLVLDENDEL
jgi:hypothetical protein